MPEIKKTEAAKAAAKEEVKAPAAEVKAEFIPNDFMIPTRGRSVLVWM